jgi:hypothetical protein
VLTLLIYWTSAPRLQAQNAPQAAPAGADDGTLRGAEASQQFWPVTTAAALPPAPASPPLNQSGSPSAAPSPAPAPQAAPPGAVPPAAPPSADSEFALGGSAGDLGAASAPNSVAPYMIGDFFVGSGQIVFSAASTGNFTKVISQIPSAGGTSRIKISDDNSILPVDRVFFLYNYFDNAILIPSPQPHAIDVQRYTPGIERTFWDHMASIDVRMPFASTQNSDIFLDGSGADKNTEFGDMEVTLKFLLWHTDDVSIAAGVGLNLPTAPDVHVFAAQGQPATFTIENNAFHVQPYIGVLIKPNDQLFVQMFEQFDVDTNGNRIDQKGVGPIGTLRDQTLLYTDIQVGYWMYRNPQAPYITGIAPTVEYHYTTTTENARFVTSQGISTFTFGNTDNRLDIQNLTMGVQFLIGGNSTLTIAGVVPLERPSSDRQFDSEAFIQFNRFF